MDLLIKEFPPKNVKISVIQSKAAENFENRQLKHPEEFAYKDRDRRERRELLALSHKYFPPASTDGSNVLLLDGYRLCSSRTLLDSKGSKYINKIIVTNWEAGKIYELNKGRLSEKIILAGGSLGDLIEFNQGQVKMRAISCDYCCQMKDEQLEELENLFKTSIFDTSGPVILDITFCCQREKEGNRQLLEHLDEGIDRVNNLHIRLQEMAQKFGNRFTVQSRFSLMTGHKDHGMQTIVCILIPKEIQHKHTKLSKFFDEIDNTVNVARRDPSKPRSYVRKSKTVPVNSYDRKRYNKSKSSIREEVAQIRNSNTKSEFLIGQSIEVSYLNKDQSISWRPFTVLKIEPERITVKVPFTDSGYIRYSLLRKYCRQIKN